MLIILGYVSATLFVGSLIVIPIVVARLPEDFFLGGRAPAAAALHPVLRPALSVVRAVLGVVLLAAGVAMLILPGPGLLTILGALVVLEFPGKRRLELAVLRRKSVVRALNWIRRRVGRPPFRFPES